MSCRRVASLILLLASAPLWALEGKLVSTGSDTLGALSALWAQALMRDSEDVTVQVRAIGSSAAPTALIEGTAELGPMSRPMSEIEARAFTRRFGYAPTAVPVAEDRLAVFVHRSNTLRRITRQQADALFSANRRCGSPQPLARWGELGASGAWAALPVIRYGRSSASGTYEFFRAQLLCGGDYAARVNRLVGSAAVVRAVGDDMAAIGYASSGFLSNSVRRVPVVDEKGDEIGLSRDLLIYINRPPGAALPLLVSAYLREALSERGQAAVRAAGYTPLGRERRRELLVSLGMEASEL